MRAAAFIGRLFSAAAPVTQLVRVHSGSFREQFEKKKCVLEMRVAHEPPLEALPFFPGIDPGKRPVARGNGAHRVKLAARQAQAERQLPQIAVDGGKRLLKPGPASRGVYQIRDEIEKQKRDEHRVRYLSPRSSPGVGGQKAFVHRLLVTIVRQLGDPKLENSKFF